MALEPSVVNISDLNKLWPLGADPASISDDNHRNIKTALLNDFAGFTGAVLVTGVDGGAADAYTLTPVNAVVAYTAKMLILFTPTATNLTTSPTINISGLGAKSLKDVAGNAPLAGDFVSGRPYLGEYDGTNVRMMAITKNYADQLAMSAALPAQPGGSARYGLVSTLGVSSWILDSMNVRSISGASTVTIADAGNMIECTTGGFTLGFDPVATLTDNTRGFLMNTGTGVSAVTLDPSGAETIDGLPNFVMYAGEVRMWYVDGTVLRTLKLKNFYISSILNFNYIHPPGYDEIESDQVAGGGGGGSGRRGAAASTRNGGNPGGTPGRKITRHRNLTPGTSYPVVIGGNGVGGAAITADNTAGNDGTAGGNSSFNGFIAYGGVIGKGGVAGTYSHTSGSGSLSAGSFVVGTNTNNYLGDQAYGGLPSITQQITSSGAIIMDAIGECGAMAFSGLVGGNSTYGGAASSSNVLTGTAVLTTGSNSQYGVPAAGQGGWITTANTMPATAGYAGLRGTWSGTGTPGGTCGGAPTAGTNGTAATNDNECGTSGSGGGSSITVAAAAGGNGGFPGGAGGGGGASLNGNNSGKGGDGAAGRTILKGV